MGAIGVMRWVVCVLGCGLAVLWVLVQEQDNSGMGGLLGGGNSAAFGSHSASVLTKTTAVLVVLFFAATFFIALLNKKHDSGADLAAAAAQVQATEGTATVDESAEVAGAGEWWKDASGTAADETSGAAETAEN
ncbi:MAG: preprotein translocase subunit SecG [Treponemataceae bacterium]|nr:preprotein translocase subunit SecG [Treponemataceae bacterium]